MSRDARAVVETSRFSRPRDKRKRQARFRPTGLESLEDRLLLTSNPDVSIAASVVGGTTFQVGDTLTFDLTVTNSGSSILLSESGVEVTDVLPDGLSGISVTGSNWSISTSNTTSPALLVADYVGGPILPAIDFPVIQVSGTLTAGAFPAFNDTASVTDSANSTDFSTATVGAYVGNAVSPSSLSVATATGTYGGTTNVSATLSSSSLTVADELVDFHHGATDLGTAMTDSLGVASLPAASLASIDAGAYSGGLTASFAGDASYAASNGSAELTVTPAPLTITANNQTKVYGAAPPTLTASYTGFVNGDTSASLATLPTILTTATAASHFSVNPYSITASGAVDTDYSISYVAGSLSVTPAPLMITADSQTKVYGAALPTLTASYTGFVNGDTSASLATRPMTSSPAAIYSDVSGSPYAVTATGAVDGDYSIGYAPGMLFVSPAPLQVGVDHQAIVYGQVIPSLTATVTGVLNNDDVVANSTTSATLYSGVQANGYAISFVGLSGAKADDYSTSIEGGSVTPGTLTVTPAPLTVTVADQSKIYGRANPPLAGSVSGILNGDDVRAVYFTTAGPYSDVTGGGYPIIVTGISGSASGNYSLSVEGASVTPATLSVTPAPLSVVVANQGKSYGQVDPTLTGTVAGVMNGDHVTANYATAANATSHVIANGYPITVTGLSGSKAGDYTIAASTPGTMTVVPALLTVTGNNASKTYGQADPAFTANYSGFVLGQNPGVLSGSLGYSTVADATTPVGIYLIQPGGLSSTDYAIQYVGAGLVNAPAPLIVTAPSPLQFYGSAVPSLTPTFSGFVNGDTPASLSGAVTETTPLTASSNVGFYPIVPGGATDWNYAISYRFGVAGVYPDVLTETASSAVAVAGQPLPALAVSYSGFVNGDTAANLASPATAFTPATPASAPGFYPVYLTGGSSNNYIVNRVAGILDVARPQPVYNPGQVAFVSTLYTELLGRAPEGGGYAFWIGQINGGATRATVARQIFNSPEAAGYRTARHGHTVGLAQALSDAQKAQALAH